MGLSALCRTIKFFFPSHGTPCLLEAQYVVLSQWNKFVPPSPKERGICNVKKKKHYGTLWLQQEEPYIGSSNFGGLKSLAI